MPLTNAQYDSIMRDYSRTRAAHQQEAEKTRARIIAACPGLDGLLKDIQADSADTGHGFQFLQTQGPIGDRIDHALILAYRDKCPA